MFRQILSLLFLKVYLNGIFFFFYNGTKLQTETKSLKDIKPSYTHTYAYTVSIYKSFASQNFKKYI